MVTVQLGAVDAKTLFHEAGPAGVATLRVGLAALMLSPLLLGAPRPGPAARGTGAFVLGYGLCLGCMNLVFYLALARIPLGVAMALEFTGPLVLSLLASRKVSDVLWLLPAAAGVLLFSPLGAADLGRVDPLGAGLALLAGAFWALYIVCGQKAGGALGRRATVYGALIAAAIVTPLGFLVTGPRLLAPPLLLKGLLLAFLASAVPYSLEMVALTRLPTRVFGILMSAEPVVASLTAFVLLGERLTPRELVAVGAIVLASVGAAASVRAPSPADPV
jgi:inner membrane transporter RhtA